MCLSRHFSVGKKWQWGQKKVIFFIKKFARVENSPYICNPKGQGNAEIAQLVEHNLAKVGVASSSLVFRSDFRLIDYIYEPFFVCIGDNFHFVWKISLPLFLV